MSIERIDEVQRVQALLIFPLDDAWKRILIAHGCTFGMHEYGETVAFPEGTTRTLLLSPAGISTNRYRLLLPDGVELREVLDDAGTGKSRLTLVLDYLPCSPEAISEPIRKEAPDLKNILRHGKYSSPS